MFFKLTGTLSQHHVRQVDQIVEQHVVLDLEEVQPVLGGQLAGFDALQHVPDHVRDLLEVAVHLVQQSQGLGQIRLDIVLIEGL